MSLRTEYKDYQIEYEDWTQDPESEGFYIQEPRSGPYPTLRQAKAYIDKLLKVEYIPEQGFIFRKAGYRGIPETGAHPSAFEIEEVAVTRPHVANKYNDNQMSLWIKDKKGKRETRNYVFAVCAENDKLIPQIVTKATQIYTLIEEFNSLVKQLVPTKIPQPKK